jgi:protein-disulfide isomerase
MVVAMNPLPMHEHAADAARAFLAAVQLGKGEAMHKKLFALNRAKTVLTEDALRDAARDIGLDVGAFDAARSSDGVKESLTKSLALAARLDVKGTPTFFTNGRRLVGARPMEAFRALFDEELTKASKLGRGDVYAVMMKTAPDAPPPKADGPEALEHFDVDVAKSPARGALSSPITIAFFSDFECPYCVKAEKTLRDLEAQKPGQIKVAYKFRPLPMHAHARDAAKAAIAAEKQNKFWPYHDVLLQHRDALEHEDLVKYAGEVGLDLPRFERDMADPATEERIKADEKQAAALGARGTPTAFVNGYRLVGAQPLPKWIGVADHALKH